MKTSDILKLLCSPFRRRTLTRKPDLPAMMMESGLKEPPWTQSPSRKPGIPVHGRAAFIAFAINSFRLEVLKSP